MRTEHGDVMHSSILNYILKSFSFATKVKNIIDVDPLPGTLASVAREKNIGYLGVVITDAHGQILQDKLVSEVLVGLSDPTSPFLSSAYWIAATEEGANVLLAWYSLGAVLDGNRVVSSREKSTFVRIASTAGLSLFSSFFNWEDGNLDGLPPDAASA